MESVLLLVVGLIFISSALIDTIQTTIGTRGGGFLSFPLTHFLWRLRFNFIRSASKHYLFYVWGLVLTLGVIVLWLVLLWLGWAMIYSFTDSAVVHSKNDSPAELLDRLYFVGTLLTTLGTGDIVAGNSFWRFLTAQTALSGFMTATLGISYLVSLINAGVHRRRIANHIRLLGQTADDIFFRFHNEPEQLSTQLSQLMYEIQGFEQEHYAYPALAFFHNVRSELSPALAFYHLQDALLALKHCKETSSATELSFSLSLEALQDSLRALKTDTGRDGQAPPAPRWEKSQPYFESSFPLNDPKVQKLRHLAYSYVLAEGWDDKLSE